MLRDGYEGVLFKVMLKLMLVWYYKVMGVCKYKRILDDFLW